MRARYIQACSIIGIGAHPLDQQRRQRPQFAAFGSWASRSSRGFAHHPIDADADAQHERAPRPPPAAPWLCGFPRYATTAGRQRPPLPAPPGQNRYRERISRFSSIFIAYHPLTSPPLISFPFFLRDDDPRRWYALPGRSSRPLPRQAGVMLRTMASFFSGGRKVRCVQLPLQMLEQADQLIAAGGPGDAGTGAAGGRGVCRLPPFIAQQQQPPGPD